MRGDAIQRDYAGAAICVALGLAVVALGVSYGVGTLREMGSGFIPVAIGTLLTVVGIGIALAAVARPQAGPPPTLATGRPVDRREARAAIDDAMAPDVVAIADAHVRGAPEWRGWLCLVGGVLSFVALGEYAGLVPASFACVFISALGDRNNSVRGAAILAAIVTAAGVAVFYYGLSLRMPLFRFG